MAIAALILWLATIGAGWSLLAIWLVEYDRTFHETAATRLPIPVLGRVHDGDFLLDLRCLDREEEFAAQLASLDSRALA